MITKKMKKPPEWFADWRRLNQKFATAASARFKAEDLQVANRIIDRTLGRKEARVFREFLDASGLGNHPSLIRFILKVDPNAALYR